MLKPILKKIINKLGYNISHSHYSKPSNQNIVPEANDREQSIMSTALKYSMGTKPRMWSLIQSIKHIKNHDIDGDIVECGVWKGGNIICASLMCDLLKMDRTLWAYDTYEGMSEPEDIDICLVNQTSAKPQYEANQKENINTWCYSSFEEVRQNFKKELTNIEHIKMIKGSVEETLDDDNNIPQSISILRLDTDWYQSTKKELDVLYPKLKSGGVLIIDDYGHWKGSRQAVDEYFQNKTIWLHRVDYACRLHIKP